MHRFFRPAVLLLLFCALPGTSETPAFAASRRGSMRKVPGRLQVTPPPPRAGVVTDKKVEQALQSSPSHGYWVRLEREVVWGRRLDSANARSALARQRKEVDFFLRKLSEDLGGSNNRYFSEVVLAPVGVLGSTLRLEGQTLVVGVKSGLLSGLKVVDAVDLRRAWNAGRMWSWFHPIRKYWPNGIDPAGTVRSAARRLLSDVLGRAQEELEPDSGGVPAAGEREGLVRRLVRVVETRLTGAATAGLKSRALELLRGAPAERLQRLMAEWGGFVSDPANSELAMNAVVGATRTVQQSTDVEVNGLGFVFVHGKRYTFSLDGGGMAPFVEAHTSSDRIRLKRGFAFVFRRDLQFDLNPSALAEAATRALFARGLELALATDAATAAP